MPARHSTHSPSRQHDGRGLHPQERHRPQGVAQRHAVNLIMELAQLRSQARRAGLLYAIPGLTVPFALVYVPRGVFVSGNPAASSAVPDQPKRS